jgi:uncharacterized protein YbjQ (UPF0145 family)
MSRSPSFVLKVTSMFAAAATSLPGPVWARDTIVHIPLQQVLDSADFKGKSNGMKFQLGGKEVATGLGIIESHKRTNALNKSDQEACRWVAESVLLDLEAKARQMGGSAVVNIVSVYKNLEFKSDNEFECHAGTLMAAVGMRGMVVK